MPRLEHKTAVITGASSGIGRGIALAFAREGAHIVVNYNRSVAKAQDAVSAIKAAGGSATAMQADVSCPDDVARLIRDAQAELGRIDIWVNNAGADILTGTAQMVTGAIGIAKESGVLWFGTQSNQTSLAPDIVVASQVYHWEVVLTQIIDSIKNGTLGGTAFAIDLANGGEVIEFNPGYAVPQDVLDLADQTVKGIADGSITVP